MKNLPIGQSTFESIVEDDLLYVDKTKQVHELVSKGSRYFVSRPRRFGKSLLVSTLDALFSGRKDLFKGLWIENAKWEWKKYPVLRLDLSGCANKTGDILEKSVNIE